MRWWEWVRVRRPLLQRVGWGMRREETRGKWMRGMEGEEGEAVTEEVGTWWRTLGPVEAILAQMFEVMVVRIRGEKGKRPSVTSKVAKKIALSISRDGWKFTRLDGSVVGVVVSHHGHEVRWSRETGYGPAILTHWLGHSDLGRKPFMYMSL